MNEEGKKELVRQVGSLVSSLIDSLTLEEKKEIFRGVLEPGRKGMPISVFKSKLSGLEILTKYLREVEKKPMRDISGITNRKVSTIYNTYRNSKEKFQKKLDISDSSILIPFDIFRDRKFSVLESVVSYLKDSCKLSYNDISRLLRRNYNTVKAVYRRYAQKKK